MGLTTALLIISALWTAVTIPGLLLWASGLVSAARGHRSVKRLCGRDDARYVWSRFSVLLTAVFTLVEIVFLAIGVSSLAQALSLNPAEIDRSVSVAAVVVVGGVQVAAAFLIAFVGWRWRVVDRVIAASVRARRTPQRLTHPPRKQGGSTMTDPYQPDEPQPVDDPNRPGGDPQPDDPQREGDDERDDDERNAER